MKRLSLVLIVAALTLPQAGQAGWIRIYGSGVGYCVQVTDDGNYIISSQKNSGVWLLKVDTSGNTIWSKTYTSTVTLRGNWVEQTSDGGYIIAPNRLALLKTNADGDSLWAKEYGIRSQSVQQTTDGGYIVVGAVVGYPSKFALLKTNANGDSLWMHTYLLNGWYASWGYSVIETIDKGYIAAGLIWDTLYGQEKSAFWLFKTDTTGSLLWGYTQGGEDWDKHDAGRCVRRTTDSGFIALANFGLLKFNQQGDTLWVRDYLGGSSVQEVYTEGYAITGDAGSLALSLSINANPQDIWLLKTNSNGDSVWKQTYGGGETYHLGNTHDKGFIITGSKDGNLVLIKTDSLGLLGITENPIVETDNGWNVPHSIGSYVVLHYQGLPEGFRANVFDVTGRKVDQIRGDGNEGAMTWGINYPPGVYFIQAPCTRRNENGSNLKTVKVEIIR